MSAELPPSGQAPLFLHGSGPRWLVGTTLTLILAVLAATVVWAAGPKTYATYSMLRVRQGPAVIYRLDNELLSLEAQRALIKSPLVINAALAEPGVRNLPWIASREASKTEVDWLAEQIEVRSIGGGENALGDVLQIGMTGNDPEQLAALVNAVTNAYLERVAGEERRQLMRRKDMLEEAYFKKHEDVKRRREIVRRLAGKVGTSDAVVAAAKQQLLTDYLLLLRKEITSRRIVILEKETAVAQLERTHGLSENTSQPKKKEIPPTVKIDLERMSQELETLKAVAEKMTLEFEKRSRDLDDLGTSSEELDRRQEDLAHAVEIANKLGMTLEQYDLELRAGERITKLQNAPVPTVPLPDSLGPVRAATVAICVMIAGLLITLLWNLKARHGQVSHRPIA